MLEVAFKIPNAIIQKTKKSRFKTSILSENYNFYTVLCHNQIYASMVTAEHTLSIYDIQTMIEYFIYIYIYRKFLIKLNYIADEKYISLLS